MDQKKYAGKCTVKFADGGIVEKFKANFTYSPGPEQRAADFKRRMEEGKEKAKSEPKREPERTEAPRRPLPSRAERMDSDIETMETGIKPR